VSYGNSQKKGRNIWFHFDMCALKNLRMRKLNAKVYNYYQNTFDGRDKMIVKKLMRMCRGGKHACIMISWRFEKMVEK